MKVLIVHPRLDIFGGAELVVEKLARHLIARGVDTAVLTTAFAEQVRESFENIEVRVLRKSLPFLRGGVSEIYSLWSETRRLGKNYDLVNVHNFPAEMAAFLLNKPVVWMCNEPPYIHLSLNSVSHTAGETKKSMLLALERKVVDLSIRHVAVADEYNAARFRKHYGIEPQIIRYGIDYKFFSQGDGAQAVKEFKLEGHFVIIHTGALTPMKNQLESLKTISELKDTMPSIKLILAGYGNKEYRDVLDSCINQYGLGNHICFTGHISRDKLRNLYKACNLLLHPIKAQGGWLTPFEALCAGLPVIVSEEMTAKDTIIAENIGYVTDDFTGTVKYVYEHQEESRALAAKGSEWVKRSLNWETFGDNMIDFFDFAIVEYTRSTRR